MTKLEQVLAEIWDGLSTGVNDRRHGFHHPVMSTIGIKNTPRSRVVILRHADRNANTLRFNTDVRTEKWQELQLNQSISISFYDESSRIQIRAEGTAARHKNDSLTLSAWESAQPMSRAAYATLPDPGTRLEEADDFALPKSEDEIAVGYQNFGLIVMQVKSLDWLFLRASGHCRARFNLVEKKAEWLVP